jgi:hypothetical protein
MSTTVHKARAGRIAPQKDEGRMTPSVKYFTQNSVIGAYKRLGASSTRARLTAGRFSEEHCP